MVRRVIGRKPHKVQLSKSKQLMHLNKTKLKQKPTHPNSLNKFFKQKQITQLTQNQLNKKQLNQKKLVQKQITQKKNKLTKKTQQKFCKITIKKLEKISITKNARQTRAHKALSKKYGELKKKGVNFEILSSLNYSTQMMMDLGMPVKEIIQGHLVKKNGVERLVSDITNLHNSGDPYYKKLNFRKLASSGVTLKKIRESRAQLGLLLLEGFTKQELIKAGFEEKRINSVMNLLKRK